METKELVTVRFRLEIIVYNSGHKTFVQYVEFCFKDDFWTMEKKVDRAEDVHTEYFNNSFTQVTFPRDAAKVLWDDLIKKEKFILTNSST